MPQSSKPLLLTPKDLYTFESLTKLDQRFQKTLEKTNFDLYQRYKSLRRKAMCSSHNMDDGLQSDLESDLLIQVAPVLEKFIGDLFGVQHALKSLRERAEVFFELYKFKKQFIDRRIFKGGRVELSLVPAPEEGLLLRKKLETYFKAPFTEEWYGEFVSKWLQDEKSYEKELDLAIQYGRWACYTLEGQAAHKAGFLFDVPRQLDSERLFPFQSVSRGDGEGSLFTVPEPLQEGRPGGDQPFECTDQGYRQDKALGQAHYCLHCHKRRKDSCRTGIFQKSSVPSNHGASPPSEMCPEAPPLAKDAFGASLAGCPLDQKISEMNLLKTQGFMLGALAVLMIDNPLVPATGHRVCNDCMKACIFQKQDPVNIPAVETRILKDILQLPWGVEIYSLLTRWNPLNLRSPLPKKSSGRAVFVAGLGPAGFGVSHYLLNEGHDVLAVDGLKIEPLPAPFISKSEDPLDFELIFDVKDLFETMEDRLIGGFGGVAEYGITTRWEKNFLKLIRLVLERRPSFSVKGAVFLGGTLGTQEVFEAGFDHLVLALGAGAPHTLEIENALAPGVRQASDFLMGLQLTGAYQRKALNPLQIQLPIAVVGGGLTAVDTATEALAYYRVQVERFLSRYEEVLAKGKEKTFWENLGGVDSKTAETFLEHARALRKIDAGDARAVMQQLQKWGGATLVYRKRIQEAPCYRTNAHELFKALGEGVQFMENAVPKKVLKAANGQCESLEVIQNDEVVILPAKTILVAAGTYPNTQISRMSPADYPLDGAYFKGTSKTSLFLDSLGFKNKITFLGDLHPDFSGSIVKALASAKKAAPLITDTMIKSAQEKPKKASVVVHEMRDRLSATVHRVETLSPGLRRLVVRAPQAVNAFKAGQFFRLEPFGALGQGYTGAAPLALCGIDIKGDTISFAVGIRGSSQWVEKLSPGEALALMGPTGPGARIVKDQNVILAGHSFGNYHLISVGAALKEAGCKVIYVVGPEGAEDFAALKLNLSWADQIICCSFSKVAKDSLPPQQAIHFYAGTVKDALKNADTLFRAFKPDQAQRVIVSGFPKLGEEIADILGDWENNPEASACVNTSMQCMMQKICGRCLQHVEDPKTGEKKTIFACADRDQPLLGLDFQGWQERMGGTRVTDHLNRVWSAL